MRAWVVRWTWVKTAVTGGVLLMVAAGLLGLPEASATGMRRGLSLCAERLIPSLFPFLALSGTVARTGLCDKLGAHLHGLTRRLFGLPDVCAAGILLGFVGGYPAGASVAAALVRDGRISREEGRHMLRFCVCAGPAFLIGTVGAGLLGSPASGALLLAAHWIASLCVGGLSRRPTFAAPPTAPPRVTARPLSVALTESVNEAAAALIGMSGWVALSASLLSVLDALGIPAVVTSAAAGVAEVSLGSMAVLHGGALTPFWLGLVLGWGGLSVHGQIAVLAAPSGLLTRDFFVARIEHGLLAGILSWGLFRLFPEASAVAVSAPMVQPFAGSSVTGGVALLGLCAVWLLTIRRGSTWV